MTNMIHVQVVYALPKKQVIVELELPSGSTIRDALSASGLSVVSAGEDCGYPHSLGVWGRIAKPDQVLRDRDRVEIYRPLVVDPKTARRLRSRRRGDGR